MPRVQDINQELSPAGRSIAMLALIVAGEAVFFLPFVLPRIFHLALVSLSRLAETEFGSVWPC